MADVLIADHKGHNRVPAVSLANTASKVCKKHTNRLMRYAKNRSGLHSLQEGSFTPKLLPIVATRVGSFYMGRLHGLPVNAATRLRPSLLFSTYLTELRSAADRGS